MPKIDINLKPSKCFLALTLLTVAACYYIIYTLPVLKVYKTLLWLLTTRYLWRISREWILLKSGHSIYRLILDQDGWALHTRLGVLRADLCGESTVTQWVSILRFQIREGAYKRSCVIFRDMLTGDDYRRLLVLLRTEDIHAFSQEEV